MFKTNATIVEHSNLNDRGLNDLLEVEAPDLEIQTQLTYSGMQHAEAAPAKVDFRIMYEKPLCHSSSELYHYLSFKKPTEKPSFFRFIDEVQGNSNRLKITSELLNTLFQFYDVSPRFSACLSRQHSPARSVQYDASGKPTRQGTTKRSAKKA